MNREIKFRGLVKSNIAKDIHAKEWVYGWLTKTVHNQMVVMQEDGNHFEKYIVIPESVGQYTGLKGRNGKEVYEGDVLQMYSHSDITHQHEKGKVWKDSGYVNDIRQVKWCCGTFYTNGMCNIQIAFMHLARPGESYEVIGNIYQNPELLNPPTTHNSTQHP